MSARGPAIGLAVPSAGGGQGTGVAAQATPVAPDRVAINPGELFSSAIVANGFVFTSGALGVDPAIDELAGGDITSQTEQVLANLEATLMEAGPSLDRVVKATCFLASLDDFEAFNAVYTQAFPFEPPARSTFEVAALALGARVKIDLVAAN